MRRLKSINPYPIAFSLLILLSSWTMFQYGNSDSESSVHIIMTVSGIRASEGNIQIGAFLDNESFKNEKSDFAFHFNKHDIADGTIKVEFDLPPNTYGFSLMDDENENNVMDYNFFGIPKEGFGFGDYYHTGFTKPHRDVFKMELKEGETKEIGVKMRYVL